MKPQSGRAARRRLELERCILVRPDTNDEQVPSTKRQVETGVVVVGKRGPVAKCLKSLRRVHREPVALCVGGRWVVGLGSALLEMDSAEKHDWRVFGIHYLENPFPPGFTLFKSRFPVSQRQPGGQEGVVRYTVWGDLGDVPMAKCQAGHVVGVIALKGGAVIRIRLVRIDTLESMLFERQVERPNAGEEIDAGGRRVVFPSRPLARTGSARQMSSFVWTSVESLCGCLQQGVMVSCQDVPSSLLPSGQI